MAHYTVEKLPGEPIVIMRIMDTWDARDDLQAMLDDLASVLDAAEEHVYLIPVVNDAVGMRIDDILWGASKAARSPGAMLHHPNLKELLVVTHSRLISLAARGLNSEVFGSVAAHVFSTVEDALSYARSHYGGSG